jgi:hypothetical protein
MSKNIDNQSEDILKFRPVINYVEPESEPESPNPIAEVPSGPTANDIKAQKLEVKLLADAVVTLSIGARKKLNLFTKDVRVNLDPNIDFATRQALKRQFPDKPDTFIDDETYNKALDAVRKHACNQAAKQQPTLSDINQAGKNINDGKGMDMFFNDQAKTGSLRPENMPNSQVVPPLDIMELQLELLKMLANWLWENALYPLFANIPIVKNAIPKKIFETKGFELPSFLPTVG